MKVNIVTLDNKKAGDIELRDDIFGLKVRQDIIARVVHWQLAKKRSGCHKVKQRSEITATTKKMYRQKGTGRARHGAAKAPQFRGGGVVFGPHVRDHGYKLPKKVRSLGLKNALSAKAAAGQLVVIDTLELKTNKTKTFRAQLNSLKLTSALFIDAAEVNETFKQAAANIFWVDCLPTQGINVYDIMRRDVLVLTKRAVEVLEERFNEN